MPTSITAVEAARHHRGDRYAPTVTTADGPSIGDAHTVVLVEGVSDRAAVDALARRRGRDLAAEGVAVLAMGGATNVRRFLERYGPHGLDRRIGGLCDEAETGVFLRGLERAGFGDGLSRADLETLGFQVCVSDLEDELIRALGVPAVERILDERGDLRSFRTFQQQPAQQGKSDHARLRRFLGSGAGRKIEYGAALVQGLDPTRVPPPLDRLLAHL